MNLLPLAQLALNSRPSSAIGGMSPFFLRNGYNLDPLSEPIPDPKDSSRPLGKIAGEKYVKRLRNAQEFAQAAMASAQQRYEGSANRFRRQPEQFRVGDKVWLDLRNVKTPQLSKKLAWQHAKYTVTAVPDALTVELNVPGNVHKRFHVELVKRAGTDPFPSQVRDDAQNPPVIDELGEEEYAVESILRARTVKRGRGKFRQALVKWVSEADPSWEPVEFIEDTKALDDFEALYGPIQHNDGPSETTAGKFVGPAEQNTLHRRRRKRNKKEGIVTAG